MSRLFSIILCLFIISCTNANPFLKQKELQAMSTEEVITYIQNIQSEDQFLQFMTLLSEEQRNIYLPYTALKDYQLNYENPFFDLSHITYDITNDTVLAMLADKITNELLLTDSDIARRIVWLEDSAFSYNESTNTINFQNYTDSLSNTVKTECYDLFKELFYDAVYYDPETFQYYYGNGIVTNITSNLTIPTPKENNPYIFIEILSPSERLYYDPVSELYFVRTLYLLNDNVGEDKKVLPIIQIENSRPQISYIVTNKNTELTPDELLTLANDPDAGIDVYVRNFVKNSAWLGYSGLTGDLDECYYY